MSPEEVTWNFTGVGEVHSNRDTSNEILPARLRPALVSLLQAIDYAELTSGNYWEFAVELERLTSFGLTLNDFRWLVRSHYVEHQCEVTLERDDGRAFRPSGDLTFPDRTCFILTKSGIKFSRLYCAREEHDSSHGIQDHDWSRSDIANEHPTFDSTLDLSANDGDQQPLWDPERRLLRFNGVSVKEFKWTAHNQEAVLSAFQEENWPARIDDPLPPHAEQDSKRRLSDTIKCLNRKQMNPILHFRGDGTGEGVVWEHTNRHHFSRIQ